MNKKIINLNSLLVYKSKKADDLFVYCWHRSKIKTWDRRFDLFLSAKEGIIVFSIFYNER